MLNKAFIKQLNKKQTNSRRSSVVLYHRLLTKQLRKRGGVFFSSFFNTVVTRLGGKAEKMFALSGPSVRRVQRAKQYRLITVATGPQLNLQTRSLLSRIARHGERARARRLLENAFRLLGDFQIQTGDESKLRGPGELLSLALKRLEPPFEIRKLKKRGKFTYYPCPMWSHRKRFFAAKILVSGAKRYQKLYHCPFFVALALEIRSLVKGGKSYSLKLYRRMINIGLRHRYSWSRIIKAI